MLLIITYSREARRTLHNVAAAHEETVIRKLGRAAVLDGTEHGAFLAMRLREKHGEEVQIERIVPFNEFSDVPDHVRTAARTYEKRENASTPYAKFVVGTDHPSAEEMRQTEL